MRLIDADVLIKKLNAIRWKMTSDTTPIQALEVKFGNEMLDNLVIGTVLASMPTAYDIDKVVEEIEKIRMVCYLTMGNTGNECYDVAYIEIGKVLDQVKKIVRAGAENE